MFSAQQLNSFKNASTRKTISQKTFDEAVQENIDEFDMEVEEAIASAVEEFTAQGVDLSSVYTGSDLMSHPIHTASRKVEEHVAGRDFESLRDALEVLKEAVTEDTNNKEALQAVILAAGTCSVLVASLDAVGEEAHLLYLTLQTLYIVLKISVDIRKTFQEKGGVEKLPLDHENIQVLSTALLAASAVATKDEAGKTLLMSNGAGNSILKAYSIARSSAEGRQNLVEGASSLVVSLTVADDESQPGSSAFSNARKMAQEGVAVETLKLLCSVWDDRGDAADASHIAANLTIALRQMAANDEICKELCDEGLLMVLSSMLTESIVESESGNHKLCRACLALYRQILASDYVKQSLNIDVFLDSIHKILTLVVENDRSFDYGVLDACLGTITALCLRNPDTSERLVEIGVGTLILDAMNMVLSLIEDSQSSHVPNGASRALRQGCMAIRNIASRSPGVRQTLLDHGGVQTIQAAQKVSSKTCVDVGDAAIRDLTA